MPKLLVFSLAVYSETITAEIAFKTSPISFKVLVIFCRNDVFEAVMKD